MRNILLTKVLEILLFCQGQVISTHYSELNHNHRFFTFCDIIIKHHTMLRELHGLLLVLDFRQSDSSGLESSVKQSIVSESQVKCIIRVRVQCQNQVCMQSVLDFSVSDSNNVSESSVSEYSILQSGVSKYSVSKFSVSEKGVLDFSQLDSISLELSLIHI